MIAKKGGCGRRMQHHPLNPIKSEQPRKREATKKGELQQ
jgi:hypothetical protein